MAIIALEYDEETEDNHKYDRDRQGEPEVPDSTEPIENGKDKGRYDQCGEKAQKRRIIEPAAIDAP